MADLDRDAARARRDEARPYWESVKRSDFAAYDVLSILNDADALDSRLDAAEKERDALRVENDRLRVLLNPTASSGVYDVKLVPVTAEEGTGAMEPGLSPEVIAAVERIADARNLPPDLPLGPEWTI